MPKSPDNKYYSEADAIAELRNLLVGPEQQQLNKLQERLEDPKAYAEDLSRVLPEAIILRSLQQDEQLTEALLPTVEEAIQASVKKDLNVLANAIFPVIGPAIRKSISTTLNVMLQSLNQTLEHSFSPESFKWRLEARQTGKSFAEVVLLRTLVYRVEQIFLIHKQTGLVLQHVVAQAVAVQDADLVSAMLTAIQDFVRDSFQVEQGEELDALHFGELTIWIEQGPQAILAAVIRGNAPKELRLVLQNTIEKIHVEFHDALVSFQGDNAIFEKSRHYLESCLQAQYQIQKTKNHPLLWVLLSSILLAGGVLAFFSIQEQQRWTTFINHLQSQPGIVVISTKKQNGKYIIYGLRDPLAVAPLALMKQSQIDPQTVITRWEPYLSFDPTFILQRTKQILQPPSTVSLEIDANGILSASGFAPRQWILATRKLVRGIPGVTQFQEANLLEADLKQLELSKAKIEEQLLLFQEGSTQLLPGQQEKLQIILRELKKISIIAPIYRKNVNLQIIGRADNRGDEAKNLVLSQARAYAILSILEPNKFPSIDISAVGVGIKQPILNEVNQKKQELNRSSSFRVFITDAPNNKFSK